MKKILLLFCALLATMGAGATVTQPTLTTDANNPTYYVIQNFRSGKYANFAGESAQLTQVESSSAGVSTLWYFVANGDGVSIVPATAPTLKLATTSSATEEGAVWYIPENPYNSGTFCVSLTSGATANCWDDQGSHTTIGYWRPAEGDYAGTSWYISEIPVTKAEVDAGTVDVTFALNKLDALARLLPFASLSVYTDANVAAVRNATDATALNTALKAFETNITLFCRSNKYLVVGESACSYNASPTGFEEIIQLVSAGNGTFYLKGYKSEKYIGNVTISTAITTDATPTTAFYFESYNGYTVVRPSDTSSSYDSYRYIHNGGSGCVGWSANGDNTQHTIAEVELPSSIVDVTYHLMVDGVDKTQSTVTCGVGDAPDASVFFSYPYTTLAYDVETITASTTDIYVTASFNMPFSVCSDYNTATWYYMNGHGSRTDYYISTTDDGNILWAQGNEKTDAYKWAFIGNPVDGIKLINKASGEGKYLQDTNPATMGATAKTWVLKQQTNTTYQCGDKGFGLWDSSLTYLNTQASTLKYWGSFDQGSTFWVTEVPSSVIEVTYNLVVGGVVVNTVVVRDVTQNSDVEIPANLISAYSPLCYDLVSSGTIGTENCTITVTGTLKTSIVTALTGLSNSKAYKLSTARGDLYIKNNHLASNYYNNPDATAGIFALITYEDNYYLYSVDASKFVLNDGNLSESVTSDVVAVSLTAQPINYLYLMLLGTNGVNVTNTKDLFDVNINDWVTPDAGNRYAITEVSEFDPTAALAALEFYFHPSAKAKYVISDASGVVLTETLPATIGETITELPTSLQRPFCSYSNIKETMIAGENTINVTVSYDLPFEVGTDKLYYAKLRGHFVYYSADDNDVRTNQSSKEDTDAYKWSFYGNPYEGIKVKNAATGTYLTNTNSTVQLTETGFAWTIHRLNDTSYTFGLANGASYINEQNRDNHNLIYWTQFTNDLGSQWNVEEVLEGEGLFNSLIAQLEAIPFGTGLNKYKLFVEETDYTTQAATIISGLKSQGYSEENLAIAQKLLDATIINLPAAGFYRIKGKTSGKYLAAGLASNTKFNMSDATDATTIFYFDGTTLRNASTGLYNGMSTSAWAWVEEDAASTVVFHDGLTNGGYAIKSNEAYFYDNGDNSDSADRGGNLTINASTNGRYTNWYLELASLPGDVNNDGSVTIADVTALVNIILGKDTENVYNHDAADVNGDESITIADVTALVNIILGKTN